MQDNNRRVTLIDVAKKAGVSASTVSRALKNDPRISEIVTEKVKRIAVEMGYIPNITARSLKTGHTNIIGLLVRDISDEWSAAVIPAIEHECSKHNLALLLSNADSDPQRERYYLEVFQQRNAEGVIILTPVSSNQIEYLPYARSVPMVLVDTFLDQPLINTITVDHELGSYMSTNHLLELGHREIVFISGPLEIAPSRKYKEGFNRALRENQINEKGAIFRAEKIIDVDHGYRAMQEVLRWNPNLTAVATGSDLMAAGAMKAIKDYGLNIPEDISIVGYDDIPLSNFLDPALTTIRQDRGVLGELAVEILLDLISGNADQVRQITIPPEIILRESTAPVKIKR
jgi:DNA-binding LacI/PurR family transcriptional regulator